VMCELPKIPNRRLGHLSSPLFVASAAAIRIESLSARYRQVTGSRFRVSARFAGRGSDPNGR
jgi:hypothetical protein